MSIRSSIILSTLLFSFNTYGAEKISSVKPVVATVNKEVVSKVAFEEITKAEEIKPEVKPNSTNTNYDLSGGYLEMYYVRAVNNGNSYRLKDKFLTGNIRSLKAVIRGTTLKGKSIEKGIYEADVRIQSNDSYALNSCIEQALGALEKGDSARLIIKFENARFLLRPLKKYQGEQGILSIGRKSGIGCSLE